MSIDQRKLGLLSFLWVGLGVLLGTKLLVSGGLGSVAVG
jgi:hypothetical protein